MENKCICCGVTIPEGRQVCPYCEAGVISKDKEENLCWSRQLEINLMKLEKVKMS